MVSTYPRRLLMLINRNKEWMLAWSIIIVSVVVIIHFWPQPPSPVPPSIKGRANFLIIYPRGYSIDGNSWKYQPSQLSVEFAVHKDTYTIVFTEEKTPLAYQDDAASYNRFIGSLRPRINFTVPFGTVSITNFVTQGSYQVVGETGILNTKGTLLLAHPDTQFTDDQWRSLFTSLRVDD